MAKHIVCLIIFINFLFGAHQDVIEVIIYFVNNIYKDMNKKDDSIDLSEFINKNTKKSKYSDNNGRIDLSLFIDTQKGGKTKLVDISKVFNPSKKKKSKSRNTDKEKQKKKEYKRLWNEKNKLKIKTYNKMYKSANKDEVSKINHKYYERMKKKKKSKSKSK